MDQHCVVGSFGCAYDKMANGVRPFDPSLLTFNLIESSNLFPLVTELTNWRLTKEAEIAWLLKAVSLIDLTSLSGDDTPVNIHRLCSKAKWPLSKCIAEMVESRFEMNVSGLHTAAVCVYPYQVKHCVDSMNRLEIWSIPIASVATGFPSGQYPLNSRLCEIRSAISRGATEIDIVINRTLALQSDWLGIYEEVRAMREACGSGVVLKSILATGELGSYDKVYSASMACMLAGADFIKTSTGKETVNATLLVSLVMARAIRDFYDLYNYQIGFKPAGGIKTSNDAIDYMKLVYGVLGPSWIRPNLLRIGASSLLSDIERQLYHLSNPGLFPSAGLLDYF